jgi:cell division septum initiation protein DivIVA
MPLQTAADMAQASERAQCRIISSAEDKAQSIIRQADAQAAVLLADAKRRAAAEDARVERWRNEAQSALARLSASL